jgi:DNA topoisomerase IB
LALLALAKCVAEPPTKKAVVDMVRQVAKQLGNTPAVCRKCYIHPAIIESFATGKLAPFVATLDGTDAEADMGRVERALLRFLDARGVPAVA